VPRHLSGSTSALLRLSADVEFDGLFREPHLKLVGSRFVGFFKRGHPLVAYGEMSQESYRALEQEGDYRRAVTYAQTAVEILLDRVLALMLWEEDEDPTQTAETIFSSSFPKRVRTHFPPRLGGDWNTRGTGEGQPAVRRRARRQRRLHQGSQADHFIQSEVAQRSAAPCTESRRLGRSTSAGHLSFALSEWKDATFVRACVIYAPRWRSLSLLEACPAA
jgi:hypothetical protein